MSGSKTSQQTEDHYWQFKIGEQNIQLQMKNQADKQSAQGGLILIALAIQKSSSKAL